MTDEQVNNSNGHEFGKEAEKYISKLPGFLQQVAWNAFLTGASIGAKKYKNAAAVNSITVENINYTTDEQIKQNAKAYAEILAVGNKEHYHVIYTAAKEGYETGAHSRDNEIDRLNDKLSKQAMLLEERGLIRFSNLNAQLETENACIKNQIEELSEQLKMNAENIQKHHNPWISVEDRLPEEMEAVLVVTNYGNLDEFHVAYRNDNFWQTSDYMILEDGVQSWMPIPKLKKVNEKQ